MSDFLVRAANDFLGSIIKRPFIPSTENSNLKKALQEKDEEISRLNVEVQDVKNDSRTQETRIVDLEANVSMAQGDIRDKRNELNRLRTEVDKKENIRLSDQRLVSLQHEISSFRSSRDKQSKLRTEIDNFHVTLNVKDVSLQHEIQDAKEALKARDQRIVSLIRGAHTIRKEEGLSAAHEMLKKARSEMTEGISQLAGELEKMTRKNDEMEVKKRTLLGRLEEHSAETERTLAEWRSRHNALESKQIGYQEAQRALEEQLERNNAELDRVQTQLYQCEQALSAALDDAVRKDQDLTFLRSSLSSAQNEIDARDSSLIALQQELDMLTTGIEALRSQNGILEEKVKSQTVEAQTIQRDATDVKSRHAEKDMKGAKEGAFAKAEEDLRALRKALARAEEEMAILKETV